MLKKIYISLSALTFCFCGEKTEKLKIEKKLEPNIESITEIKNKSELGIDYLKAAELFAKEVLKENFRIHEFDIRSTKNPSHSKIFIADGLEKITAYSSKEYPKNSQPRYYEQFMLLVASYKDTAAAQNTFNRMLKESVYDLDDLRELNGELGERVSGLLIGAKPGGLITKQGKHIFSLVETCRETPIGGSWLDYESKFLTAIVENTKEIQVLNSNCGWIQYVIENRKASNNFRPDSVETSQEAKTTTINCSDQGCEGIYTGPEFVDGSDIAHQFSNRMSAKVGNKLKELYSLGDYAKVDFSKIKMSTVGMGSGNVVFDLNIPFKKVKDKCSAFTSFDHVGGWNHKPALARRKEELKDVLMEGQTLHISELKKTPEGLQEYWIQWKNKKVQSNCK